MGPGACARACVSSGRQSGRGWPPFASAASTARSSGACSFGNAHPQRRLAAAARRRSNHERAVAKSDVATMKSSAVSLMPEGLWQNLTAEQQRDLMTYLLTEAPVGVRR